ncbi:retrovirus-related pol polyprotein from transposon TNT 1-94 [Tanacetum coccineum]
MSINPPFTQQLFSNKHSIPQLEYAPYLFNSNNQKFPTDSVSVVPVLPEGDDPIDALRTSSNTRQTATSMMEKVGLCNSSGDDKSTYAARTTRNSTGECGSNTGKQRDCYFSSSGQALTADDIAFMPVPGLLLIITTMLLIKLSSGQLRLLLWPISQEGLDAITAGTQSRYYDTIDLFNQSEAGYGGGAVVTSVHLLDPPHSSDKFHQLRFKRTSYRNACPLTRITTTNEVPSRKPIVLDSESPKPVVKLVYSRKPRKNKNAESVSNTKVVQIVLWYLDSGCSKHMTGDRSQLTNFVSKFLGFIILSSEGLGHNLFSVGQFCDSNLEVAFRQHTCFIRNLEGVDLLTGSRGDNLYTLSLGNMMASSPICLLSKASKTKSWLWHRRLSHLNLVMINNIWQDMDLHQSRKTLPIAYGSMWANACGVSGKKYILVIVDDYSRFTWVKCLRSKDEAPAFIINFLKMIQVRLKETVRRIRTDNGTEFVNQTLREYYEKVGISHETSVARSPQQNGVVGKDEIVR